MLLEIISLVLFICLIVYFVITIIVIRKYKRMKDTSNYLLSKYYVINKKSFVLDRYLSLYDLKKVSISDVYSSFFDLYKEVLDIEEDFRGE